MSEAREPISLRTGALIALVGVFAFSALLALLAYGSDLRGGDDGQAQALSKSAVGFAGVGQALRLEGQPVVINRAPLPPGRRAGVLVVTPPPGASRSDVDALAFAGPVLVVLPKWLAAPDLGHRGWVKKAALLDTAGFPTGSLAARAALSRRIGVTRPVLRGAGAPFAAAQTMPAGPVDSLQSMTAPGWIPILADDTGGTILARDPHRPLYVLSDPDLLDTQGVADIRTLAVGLTLLRTLKAADGPVIFDVRLNGLGRTRSVLRLLLDPPFLAATLCLATAAALAGLQALSRFGPVRRGGRAIPFGKAALVDNTAALIHLAGREHRMGGRYADLTGEFAARAVGAPRGLGGEALVAFLDRLGARRRLPSSLAGLESDARMASNAARLLDVARRLYRWRLQMAGPAGAALDPKPETGSVPDPGPPSPA